MKTAARSRIGIMLIILGLFLVRLCVNYILFTEKCEQARDRVRAAEHRCVEIAGWMVIAEGTVMRAALSD